MKNYDEVAKSVLARRDAHNAAVKRRNRIALRIGIPVVSLCLAAMIGVGFHVANENDDPPLLVDDALIPGIDDTVDPDELVTDGPVPGGAIIDPAIETDAVGNDDSVKKADGQEDECSTDDTVILIPWNELMLYAKYPEFELGDKTYTTATTWIDSDKLGDAIGTTTAYGYDIYEDKSYEIGIAVYPIKGISTDAAVAVSYDGFAGQYAVYTNHQYKPATLGEFIDALGLNDNLSFGSIYHTYWEDGCYIIAEYGTSDTSVIWDMLLSDGNLVNVAEDVSDKDMSSYKESMSVSVNVDILGIKNVSLGVTENGYLSTNILGTRKLFYIGEEKVQKFIEYVQTNFENIREDRPATTTAADVRGYPDDTVMTAVTQISPPYDPSEDGKIWAEK